MERFFYEAIDGQGRRVIDSDTANDRESLLLSLQTQGLVVVRWLEGDRPRRFRLTRRGKSLKSGELLQLTKELSHLLKSGLPLDRALSIIGESTPSSSVKTLLAQLKEAIRGGKSLSEAVAEKPGDFSELYVNMVRVGEVGGVLPQALEKVVQFMERTEEIKRFIISSSIYPIILLTVGFISIFVIMGFVVPRFSGIFIGFSCLPLLALGPNAVKQGAHRPVCHAITAVWSARAGDAGQPLFTHVRNAASERRPGPQGPFHR
jgi:general secretion pathway protein F